LILLPLHLELPVFTTISSLPLPFKTVDSGRWRVFLLHVLMVGRI
jgi:hypothetical protein